MKKKLVSLIIASMIISTSTPTFAAETPEGIVIADTAEGDEAEATDSDSILTTNYDYDVPYSSGYLVYNGEERTALSLLPSSEKWSYEYAEGDYKAKNVGMYITGFNATSSSYPYKGHFGFAWYIDPRVLLVNIDSVTKHAGEEDPEEYTYSIASGTVCDGDTVDLNITRTPGEEPGTYPITITSTEGSYYFGGYLSSNKGTPHYDSCKENYFVLIKDDNSTPTLTIEPHTLKEVPSIAATCTSDGIEGYWECTVCDARFSDEEATKEIEEPQVIKATGHDIKKVSAHNASCTEDGNIEYWKCEKCGALFSDENGKNELNDISATVISKTNHNLQKVDKKTATLTKEGNIEYWYCKSCKKYFSDATAETEITKADTVLPKLAPLTAAGKEKNGTLIITWDKISGADGYDMYTQYCDHNFTKNSLKQVKNGNTAKLTIKKINGKKLNSTKNIKFYVVAYKWVNGKKLTLTKSVTCHIVGSKSKNMTNIKSFTLNKTSYSLRVGKTAKISGKVNLVNKKKSGLDNDHASKFRFISSNKKVATIDKNGKITAIGTGKATIYVYTRDGKTKKVTVTVK